MLQNGAKICAIHVLNMLIKRNYSVTDHVTFCVDKTKCNTSDSKNAGRQLFKRLLIIKRKL